MSTSVFFVMYLSLVIRVFSLPTAVNVKTMNKSESSERSLALLDILSKLSDITKHVQSLTVADVLPIVESVEGVHGRRVKRHIMINGNCAAGKINLRGICLSPEEFNELAEDEEFNEYVESLTAVDVLPSVNSVEGVHGIRVKRAFMNNGNCAVDKIYFKGMCLAPKEFYELAGEEEFNEYVESLTAVDVLTSVDSVEGVHGRRVKRAFMNNGNCAVNKIYFNGMCLALKEFYELAGDEEFNEYVESLTAVDVLTSVDSVEGVHGRRVKRAFMNNGNCAVNKIYFNGMCLALKEYDELTGN